MRLNTIGHRIRKPEIEKIEYIQTEALKETRLRKIA